MNLYILTTDDPINQFWPTYWVWASSASAAAKSWKNRYLGVMRAEDGHEYVKTVEPAPTGFDRAQFAIPLQ